MIHSIRGKVACKTDKYAVLETGALAFRILCAPSFLAKLHVGSEAVIFTRLFFEREELQLYGFTDQKNLELFDILNNINGIGAKTALSLSSFGSIETLKKALESGKPLPGVKGIGQKKMQRVLLELTGKIKELDVEKNMGPDEAAEALISLGFSQNDAKMALSKIPADIKEVRERIKAALKILGQK